MKEEIERDKFTLFNILLTDLIKYYTVYKLNFLEHYSFFIDT